MINLTIKKSQFPDDAKMAVFAPLHYKNSCLDKENFRLVSILPILSKLYEKALNAQLTEYSNHLDIFRSGFRTQYGCQSTLLRVIEDWKQALDQNKYVAAILMDLFKAFDCLSHDLLLLKLKTYGLSENALKLMASYLTNRKQCIKLGNFKSNFQSILKGVPQGSILGPVLFNIFINDIFHFIKNCKLYNYADDNTVSHTDTDSKRLIDELVEDSTRLIQWFADNQMKANPGKFQAIAVGKHTHSENICFNLSDNIVRCEDSVKLLSVTFDFKLDFDEHISNVCKKSFTSAKCFKENRWSFMLTRKTKCLLFFYYVKF